MKELQKISLETMRQRMQILNREEQKNIAGGAAIDDAADALRRAGWDVNVYSDPFDVPEDLWNTGSTSSSSASTNYSASRPYPGSIGNPYYLNEVIVEANRLPGQCIGIHEFSSLADYVDYAFNTAWYDSMAKAAIGALPGIGGIAGATTSLVGDHLQNAHSSALQSLLRSGYANDVHITVSTRHRWDTGKLPETEIRVYNNKNELISTTGWR